MNNYCSIERNIQILIEVLKANGIHKVIASPGATNVSLNASLQHDSWFEMYSEVDERNAAYMACGMAAESQEPVVITCTGATSSRNYMPGLTEAYYRKLPILAVTCSRNNAYVGHLVDQVTDRSNPPSDTVMFSVNVQAVRSDLDEWDVVNKINKAVLGLSYNGGGPCHINLETTYQSDFSVKKIPSVRCVKRYLYNEHLPEIPLDSKVGIFVGAHEKWSPELTDAVSVFCGIYDAVVLCDHTSNYKGEYRLLYPLIFDQVDSDSGFSDFDLIIHIGSVSNGKCNARNIWRVNIDGELCNTFGTLKCVFQMSEIVFFKHYIKGKKGKKKDLLDRMKGRYTSLLARIPELPLSNIWVAQQLASRLPKNSVLHLGIRNSIRSWGYFDVDDSILGYCNTGGFGIDGGISSQIGASLCHPEKIYYGVYGDLLFFYNMNAIGNRNVRSNVRILVINNGLGQEFRNYSCRNSSVLGDDVNLFIAAQGHFGKKSKDLIKCYAESLGFRYICASSKDEFEEFSKYFVDEKIGDAPILFEVFTNTMDETKALEIVNTFSAKSKMIKGARDLISKPEFKAVKDIAKRILK